MPPEDRKLENDAISPTQMAIALARLGERVENARQSNENRDKELFRKIDDRFDQLKTTLESRHQENVNSIKELKMTITQVSHDEKNVRTVVNDLSQKVRSINVVIDRIQGPVDELINATKQKKAWIAIFMAALGSMMLFIHYSQEVFEFLKWYLTGGGSKP